jgi:hypothetical protein
MLKNFSMPDIIAKSELPSGGVGSEESRVEHVDHVERKLELENGNSHPPTPTLNSN